MSLVEPLGGVLVDRTDATRDGSMAHRSRLAIELSRFTLADFRLIANGAYSPLAGFMTRSDYQSVVDRAALCSGVPWTLPIVLPVPSEIARTLSDGAVVLLTFSGDVVGTLTVTDVFERDVEREASEVYRTRDADHPGVRSLREQNRWAVGGDITALPSKADALTKDPAQTRSAFVERGWKTVVAFQTRNPIHRAHEYLTKVALEQVDGLLIHPLSGVTKDDDVPFGVRMRCYQALVEGYYPSDRVVLTPWPAAMRYAGPREAIFHGIVRRNYGCTHFIIGRDAAGVGSYYGPYDAQKLYDELGGADRLGFTAVKFEHAFWCRRCEGMASTRTCPHDSESRVVLSGTKVREMLTRGETIPEEFTRPEVAAILRDAYGVSTAAVS
ncbi:MAG: sulfate adenylyltransferase [Candidatus Dormibacteraeota bacterium]|nr:sulfate adenylyltransferase [Candidatus Dormibacteraeota bacterium]